VLDHLKVGTDVGSESAADSEISGHTVAATAGTKVWAMLCGPGARKTHKAAPANQDSEATTGTS
jgi:hypothetical protein